MTGDAARIEVAVTAILCGPATPTDADLAMVRDFNAWLGGDRSRWDADGRDQVDPGQPAPDAHPGGGWISGPMVAQGAAADLVGQGHTVAPWRFLVIASTGELTMHTTTPALVLSALQSAVGGYIEPVAVEPPDLLALANEDGAALDLAPSPIGTAVLRELGAIAWFFPSGVLGPIAFIGSRGTVETGLTNEQITLISEAHSRVSAP